MMSTMSVFYKCFVMTYQMSFVHGGRYCLLHFQDTLGDDHNPLNVPEQESGIELGVDE